MRASSTLLSSLLCSVAIGCGSSTAPPPDEAPSGRLRAVLLPYEAKDFRVAGAAATDDGWLLAVESAVPSEAFEVWDVRGASVFHRERTALPAEVIRALACEPGHPPEVRRVSGFSASHRGDGLVLVAAGCARTEGELGVFFERSSAGYRLVGPSDVLPPGLKPVAITCGEAACGLLFDVAASQADPTGPSSFSVARFRSGAWDRLVLDERESSDARGFVPRGIAPLGDGFLVTGTEYVVDGDSTREWARAFRTTGDSAESLDVASLTRLTPPVASSGAAVSAGMSDAGMRVLSMGVEGAPKVLVPDRADAAGLRFAASLGSRVVTLAEVPRAGAGYDFRLDVDGTSIGFPKMSEGASVEGVAVRGAELLVYGAQLAARPNAANATAPLLVLVTANASVPDAAPLPDEAAAGCSVARDCGGGDWNVRCSGHFACEAGACTPVCDFAGCGDGKCNTEGGESKTSCPADCANRSSAR